MKMNIELTEDQQICPLCNGSGKFEQSIYVCEKCDGTGIVDWITNAVTRKKKRSSLDEINVRRVVMHLKSLVNKMNSEVNDKNTAHVLKGMMDNYLMAMKGRKVIDNYQISKSFAGGYGGFDVLIKPFRTVKTVKMSLTIKIDDNK